MTKSNSQISVFLDTTNLFTSSLNLEINKPVSDFCNFRDSFFNNLSIIIPRVVFNERKFKNLKFFNDNKKQIIDSSKKIKEEMNLELNLDDLNTFNADKIVEDKLKKSLEDKKINVYDCQIDGEEILRRRFLETKPFTIDDSSNQKKENGIKDTAIWMSFKEYFKSNLDKEIIFVTGNTKDFNEDVEIEFFNEFRKKLLIFIDLPSVENYLSTKYGVGNKADIARKIKIESLVKRSIGDIIVKLHQQETEQMHYFGITPKKYIGFRLEDIEEWSIKEDNLTQPTITVKIIVSAYESSNQDNPQSSYASVGSEWMKSLQPLGSFYPSPYFSLFPEKKYVEAEIKLDLSSDPGLIIEIKNIKLDLFSFII